MPVEEELIGQAQETYGGNYQNHLIEQYKIYVELADRVSQRRINARNTFFAITNTILLSGFGILASLNIEGLNSQMMILIGIFGILYTISWRNTILSYRQLNMAKFRIIYEIEKHLPLRLFKAEWAIMVEMGKASRYSLVLNVEQWAPIVFLIIYCIIVISGIITVVTL